MSQSTRLACAALVIAAWPLGASAQQAGALNRLEAVPEDTLLIDAHAGFEYHSNLFASQTERDDILLKALLGVTYDRAFGTQRLRIDGSVTPTKFLDFNEYDNVGYNLGALWDLEVGRPVFWQFEARLRRFQSPFDAVNFGVKNNERRSLVRALGGFRMTPSWAVFAAIDRQSLDNSTASLRGANFDATAYEAGLRYQPEAALEADLFYRRTDGKYPNRQVFDSLGNLLPTAVDNAYSQNEALIRIAYRPSELTRLAGRFGLTDRSYDNVSQRDFSGFTFGLEYDWSSGGPFAISLDAGRTIDANEALSSSYVDVRQIVVSPRYRLSGKVELTGVVGYARRVYEGDPGFVTSGAAVRDERLTRLGVGVRYEVSRNFYVTGDLWQQRRASNYDQFDFTDDVIAAGIQMRF